MIDAILTGILVLCAIVVGFVIGRWDDIMEILFP